MKSALWLSLLIPFVAGFACTILPECPQRARGHVLLRACHGHCRLCRHRGGVSARHCFASPRTGFFWIPFQPIITAILLLVFCLSSVYAWVYFGEELRKGHFTRKQARLFSGLWCFACAAMTLVLFSNNLGIMWVGIEATTLITAFLICIQVSRQSMEAMWKYIVICSVGMAFAFMGTLLIAASAKALELGPP